MSARRDMRTMDEFARARMLHVRRRRTLLDVIADVLWSLAYRCK